MRYFAIYWSEDKEADVMYVKSKNVPHFSKEMYFSNWPYQLPPAEMEIVNMALKARVIDSNEANNVIRVDELIPGLFGFNPLSSEIKEI